MSSDAVHITADIFFRRIRPAQNHFDFGILVVLHNGKELFMSRFLAGIFRDLFNVSHNAFRMMQLDGFFLLLIMKHQRQATVNERDILKMLTNGFGVEDGSAKDLFVWAKEDRRAAATKRFYFLYRCFGLSAFKRLAPFETVTMHGRDHF